MHMASSSVTPLQESPPTETSEFAAHNQGSYLRTRAFVGSCLPTCRKLIRKRAHYLYFPCPMTHLAHGPRTKPAGGLVPPSRGAVIKCLRAEPTQICLEAATELQLELFVVQTRIRKNYFSRFLLVLSQQPFVCDPRAQSRTVGWALSLSGQFPLLQAV